MPDQIITEAAKPFLDMGIVGAICVVLAAVIVWQTRVHRSEMREERESHQKTREAHIKAMEAGFGLTTDIKEAVQAIKESGDQWIELAKAVVQSKGDRA